MSSQLAQQNVTTLDLTKYKENITKHRDAQNI